MKSTLQYPIDYAILSAMPEELDFLIQEFSGCQCIETKIGEFNFRIYYYKNNNILLASTGIGTTFAASLLTFIYSYFNPEYFLALGTAGGIKSSLKIRDVVIVETAFEAEIQDLFTSLKNTPFEGALKHPLKNSYFPAHYSANLELLNLCESFNLNNINIHKGCAVSSNTFPAPKELFAKIKKLDPYLIDMETSAFYQVAWLLNIKILAIRGISNILNSDGIDEHIHESDILGSSKMATIVLLAILNKSINLKNKLINHPSTDLVEEVTQLIKHYHLQPHAEGGYFSPLFKSNNIVKVLNNDAYNDENRSAGSSIYYLLNKEDYSAWHILKSDELWNFHKGSPLNIHVINENGNLFTYLLGDPFQTPGATFQICIKAGNYFCAENIDKSTYSLVSCIVIPGFEYNDFKLADKNTLLTCYPQHREIIERFVCKKN